MLSQRCVARCRSSRLNCVCAFASTASGFTPAKQLAVRIASIYLYLSSSAVCLFVIHDVFYELVYTTPFIATAMTTPDSNYDASASDFTWPNAKALWVMVIIGAGLIFLRIIYKFCMKMHQRRVQRDGEHEFADLVQGSTRIELEGDAIRLQRPSRAVTRRSSEVSALPRYERFDEGELCDEDARIEKRGRYSYVLGERWPGKR